MKRGFPPSCGSLLPEHTRQAYRIGLDTRIFMYVTKAAGMPIPCRSPLMRTCPVAECVDATTEHIGIILRGLAVECT